MKKTPQRKRKISDNGRASTRAIKKSKTFKGLRVATPQNTALAFLEREGLVVPEEIPSDEDLIPLDFTRLDRRDVGALHSRYAVRHAYAIFVTAKTAAELAYAKRDLRFHLAKFRHAKHGDFKTRYELDDASLRNKAIRQLSDRVTELEAHLTVLEAVSAGYEDFRNAASREMTRRYGEQAAKD